MPVNRNKDNYRKITIVERSLDLEYFLSIYDMVEGKKRKKISPTLS